MTVRGAYKNIFAPFMMIPETIPDAIQNFCLVGINYRKSDIRVRGKFSLSKEHSISVLQEALVRNLPGCMVLSTCNRTEIYGLCEDPDELAEMLCGYTHGGPGDFTSQGYRFRGLAAIRHLCKVAAGLDSQIIGDYEILSQLKLAARLAKENRCMNSFMERIVNYALRASKEIKTTTRLSSGTVSVAYAAIGIIRERFPDTWQKRILLAGTGKLGNHIGKNLRDYLPGCSLFFTNRTDEKAIALAAECGAKFVPYQDLPAEADAADIIIVSSTAESYTIVPSFFVSRKERLILDLSVPQNVSPELRVMEGVTLLNVDEISARLNQTISIRQAEIPQALSIINHTMEELSEWHHRQMNNPVLRKMKVLFHELCEADATCIISEEKIHKAVSSLAVQLHSQDNKGCQCISAMNGYLQIN
jgi:glutamyl-tRNA reductase